MKPIERTYQRPVPTLNQQKRDQRLAAILSWLLWLGSVVTLGWLFFRP